MIRTTKHSRSRIPKSLIIGALVGVLFVASGVVYWFYNNRQSDKESIATPASESQIDYREATDDQKSTGNTIKEQLADSDQQTSSPSSSASISITSLESSDGTVYIRTLIGKVTSSGSCTVSMSGPNGKTYSKSVSVQALSSSSTCAGFDIPVGDLSTGTWKVTIDFSDDVSSGSVSGEVTI